MAAKTVKNNMKARPQSFRGMKKGDISSAENINALATEMMMSKHTDPNQKAAWARIALSSLEHINSQAPSTEELKARIESFMEEPSDQL